jgi:methyl-accepting chemotaxis protein
LRRYEKEMVMSWLMNASVKRKAITAFAIMLLCTLALGTVSLLRVSDVNTEAADVRDNWLPSIKAISDVMNDSKQYRIIEGAEILAHSDAEIKEEEKSLKDASGELSKSMEVYKSLLTPGWETENYNKFAKLINDYITASSTKVLPLARANKNEEAAALFRGESRIVFREAMVVVQELIDFNTREGVKAANKGEEAYRSARVWIFSIIAVAVAIGVAATMMIVATVVRPIQGMTAIMERLANRELSVTIEGIERKDEIGGMARSVQSFKDGLVEAERLAAAQVADQLAKQKRVETVDRLIAGFEASAASALRTVASSASELDATAHSMSAMAQQTSVQASVVASAAEQTSANVQTVATATEEMSSSIREISGQVSRSADIAGRAVSEAARTNDAVRSLSDAAQKIGEVVNLITNIASQTNLLALNATIEAARAGEAGKGFAVVANEVKSLAGQTAKATDEIASQISAIQQTTHGVVQAIAGIGGTIGSINDITTAIAAAIEEQGAATNEISRSVQEAARGTQDVSGSIGQVTQAAGEAGSAASQVLGAAGELSRQAETLRMDVERFLDNIKAA